jgi:hypothetical protein
LLFTAISAPTVILLIVFLTLLVLACLVLIMVSHIKRAKVAEKIAPSVIGLSRKERRKRILELLGGDEFAALYYREKAFIATIVTIICISVYGAYLLFLVPLLVKMLGETS